MKCDPVAALGVACGIGAGGWGLSKHFSSESREKAGLCPFLLLARRSWVGLAGQGHAHLEPLALFSLLWIQLPSATAQWHFKTSHRCLQEYTSGHQVLPSSTTAVGTYRGVDTLLKGGDGGRKRMCTRRESQLATLEPACAVGRGVICHTHRRLSRWWAGKPGPAGSLLG